nr:hypothetical protein [Tanacetum cinerariifolium]
MAENLIAAGVENRPSMLEKGKLFQLKEEITIPCVNGGADEIRAQTVADLSPTEKIQYDYDIKATKIILLRLSVDICTLINHYQTAKEIWDRVKEFMKGTKLTLQELESKLCYKCKGKDHMAKQCTATKRVKDAKSYKEKMLLAQVQEAGVMLYEDQQDFLADRLEEMDNCDDILVHTTINFKADHLDAYDSDCDDEATSCAIFMESLSLAGSVNEDTTNPSYNSELVFEVPHYDTYHEDTILNDAVQETIYNDQTIFNDNSYDELMSNNNIISYADYMVTIENDATQYVPTTNQDKNVMILSVTEQMKCQVEQCNKVNLEAKCVIELLSTELE